MMREAFLDSQRKAVEKAVGNGKGVLVVGALDTNIQPELRQHELLTVWQQGNTQAVKHPIPKHCGVVLFTRFVSHGTVRLLYKQAMANGVFCVQQVLQTGELRDVLEPLLATLPKKPAPAPAAPVNGTPVVQAAPPHQRRVPGQTAKRGEVRDLVREYGNRNAPKLADEARRLLPLAESLGIVTTFESIAQSLSKMRQEGGAPVSVEHSQNGLVYRAATPSNSPAAAAPAAPEAASMAIPSGLAGADALSDSLDEAMRLLSESIAALTLVREEIAKTKKLITNDAASLAKLRQLKELLGSI